MGKLAANVCLPVFFKKTFSKFIPSTRHEKSMQVCYLPVHPMLKDLKKKSITTISTLKFRKMVKRSLKLQP